MKTFEQVQDVLEHARLLHERLAGYYRQLEAVTANERVHMLLDYLQDHEQRLLEGLAAYQQEGPDTVLDTWLQYVPEQRMPLLPEKVEQGVTVEEALQLALDCKDYLIELYRGVATRADLPQTREAFSELMKKEMHERRQIAKNVLRLDEF